MGHNAIRAYSSRRAESFSATDERDWDATVRRKKRSVLEDEVVAESSKTPPEGPPTKSMLRPPKLAPSAWQLYFTDWIQRQQASSSRKPNVAQAAKEAGQEYANLTEEEKEPYKQRSQAAKDIRERSLNAYMRTLTPEDIKRENVFRSAQRKAGKSRKSNIKDPNAPKKPLSAYFMFLQRIRASKELVKEVFGDETETTRQSVLAAARWRGMTDEERKPFLAQAEQEKMEYEAARRMYEDGSVPYGSSINFSILPGSPAFHTTVKMESESESEGFVTDDGLRYR
ncbi:HMG-box [Mycena metata]|uniref:HMG-box n=2 Tax=Mycena metata TaxID=1033252 RepID=A0AAD7IE44_9AGAR|nr:HMG-box [Mycena metata]